MASEPAELRNPASPADLPVGETVRFLAGALRAGAELLEVGCGDGRVAAELANRHGLRVRALDADPEQVALAQQRGVDAAVADWPDYDGAPADAIAFTRSLHHLADLAGSLDRAAALLKPGGCLLIEDFALEDADARLVNWLARWLREAGQAGWIEAAPGELASALLDSADSWRAWRAWRDEHGEDLHPMSRMLPEINARFSLQRLEAVPYLYRYAVPVLRQRHGAADILQGLLREEAKLGGDGVITLIGRRMLARLRQAPES